MGEPNQLYQQVWNTVLTIPCGCVATYGQIARLIGKSRYARQVSYALAQQRRLAPFLNVPWHRVINAQGKIAFTRSDWRFEEQVFLLQKEGVIVVSGKVNLDEYLWERDLLADPLR